MDSIEKDHFSLNSSNNSNIFQRIYDKNEAEMDFIDKNGEE